MSRKVGFDRPDTEKKVADRVLDRFRAKTRAKKAAVAKAAADEAAKPRRQWGPIIFIFLWLCGWTVGVVFAGMLILAGEAEPGLIIWEVFAVIGWFVAAGVLYFLIRN